MADSNASKSLLSQKADKSLELQEALAKADEFARLAVAAENLEEKAFYQRMRRKWLGIADGWSMINNVGKVL